MLRGDAAAPSVSPNPEREPAVDPYCGVPLGVESAWLPTVTGVLVGLSLK
jgi:hypothetical protein